MTPFYSLADLITCNSATQDIAFLFFALICCGFLRFRTFLKSFLINIALVAIYLAWVINIARSSARLILADPDLLAVDFHSHTSHSWDGRGWFTPERNAAWHERMGFGAGFITDHNKTTGSALGKGLSRSAWSSGGRSYAALEGEELSLHDSHVVLLGNAAPVDPQDYQGREGLKRFLGEAGPGHGGLTLMSLPEYWKRGWGLLEKYADWGADGFEIVNAAPRAADFPEEKRQAVIALSRRRNLFVAAATDNHGYGSACCAWNVMRIGNWRMMDPDQRQTAVLQTLKRDGFKAVQIIVRRKIPPAQGAMIWADTPKALWMMARGWTWPQSIMFLLWLWAAAVLPSSRRKEPIKA